MNLYTYVCDNPILFADPLGLEAGLIGSGGIVGANGIVTTGDTEGGSLGEPNGPMSLAQEIISKAFGPPDPRDPQSMYDRDVARRMIEQQREDMKNARERERDRKKAVKSILKYMRDGDKRTRGCS